MKSTLAISTIIFTVGILTLPVVWSDNDFRWGKMEEQRHKLSDVATVKNPLYIKMNVVAATWPIHRVYCLQNPGVN